METSAVFSTMVRRLVLLFLLIVVIAAVSHGQIAGTVGIYTRQIPVFSAQATTTSSALFPDFGFAANYLTYCDTNFTGTIDMDWSPTGPSPFVPISLVQASYPAGFADNSCHPLQLGGYYQNLRSTVTVLTGSVTAWYTASAAPIPLYAAGLGTNGPTSTITCDRNFVGNASTGESIPLGNGPINPGDTIVICGMFVSFNGATAGTVSLNWSTVTACTPTSGITWESYVESNSPQLFQVSLTQRSSAPATNEVPCFVNSSGAGAIVSMSYASVHGL